MKTKTIMSFIAAGAVVGAVAAVLYAPAKGSATRKKISRTGTDSADAIKEKFDDYVSAVTKEYDNIAKNTSNLFD